MPNPKGAERALAAGADELELVVSASETHNQKNVRRSVAESLVGARELVELAHGGERPVEAIVSTAFGCPYEGDVAPERVAQRRRPPRSTPAPTGCSFGDTTGMATPRRVDDLLDALERRRHRAPTASGCTSTTRAAPRSPTSSPALERGVTRFDASIGGLGGCPYAPGASGNVVTEDLVHMLDDMDIETGIDLDALHRLRAPRAGHRRPRAARAQLLHAGPRDRGSTQHDATVTRRHEARPRSTPSAALQGNLAKEAREARAAEQAVRPRPARPPARRGLVRRGRACSPTRSPATSPPTAWSPASAASTAGRCA